MNEAVALFVFIFLASLPGRTTFVLLMLSAAGQRIPIFIGASLAFLVQVSIAVLAGQLLGVIPQAYVEIAAGVLFCVFAVRFWIESKKFESASDLKNTNSVWSVFALVFMAEFGDVSQLAIATAASRATSKFLVFGVGVVTLWFITALAVFAGARLGKVLNPNRLQKLAAVCFAVVGLYLAFHGAAAM